MPEKDSLVANHAWAEGEAVVDEPRIPMRWKLKGRERGGRKGR